MEVTMKKNNYGNIALLIIDVQKGFMPSNVNEDEMIRNIATLSEVARKSNIPVLYSKEIHRKQMVDFGRELDGSEGIHCLEMTEDVEIVEQLSPKEGDFVFTKRRYSCFYNTDLTFLLRGFNINTLIICGLLTDVCVHYTSADAHQRDYYIRVAEDAVHGSSLEAHKASLNAITYLQRDAVKSTEELLKFISENS
jgi:biuret amidohydrolase